MCLILTSHFCGSSITFLHCTIFFPFQAPYWSIFFNTFHLQTPKLPCELVLLEGNLACLPGCAKCHWPALLVIVGRTRMCLLLQLQGSAGPEEVLTTEFSLLCWGEGRESASWFGTGHMLLLITPKAISQTSITLNIMNSLSMKSWDFKSHMLLMTLLNILSC